MVHRGRSIASEYPGDLYRAFGDSLYEFDLVCPMDHLYYPYSIPVMSPNYQSEV